MNLFNKIVGFLLFSCALLTACSDSDDPVAAPPELLGTWQLTDAQTTIDDESDIRPILEQYFSDQGISVTEQKLDEITAVLDYPVTGRLNDSTSVEFSPGGSVTYRDPRNVGQGNWTYEAEDLLVLSDGMPARFLISTLTDTQMVLLLTNYEDIFRFSEIADFSYPEGTQLQYTLVKQ